MTNRQEIRVETITLKEDLSHQGKVVVRYCIEYPQIHSRAFASAASRINDLYRRRALMFQRYCRKKLFHSAVEQYEYAMANHYPLMTYEAERKFQCTYLSSCTVSLYTDTYLFSGGAHGSTTRQSDTWNLKNARQMPLSAFFTRPRFFNPLFQAIEKQVSRQLAENPGSYFEHTEQAVREEFDPRQFYLTGEGVMIYYQQYSIAPYSTGIPTFLIPYGGLVRRPSCGKNR